MTYGTGAEAWPQLAAIPRNSGPEPTEPHLRYPRAFFCWVRKWLLAKKMDCRVISAFTRVFDARLATAQCFCGTARHSAHASEGRLGPGPRELMIESTASELSDLELDEMI